MEGQAAKVVSLDSYVDAAKRRKTQSTEIVGTVEEIERSVSAQYCNLVQHAFKRFRDDVGACEHCGSTDRLERAHRSDCARPVLLRRAIQEVGRRREDGRLEVSSRALQLRFLEFHRDDFVGRRLLVLCNPCHRRYDCVPSPSNVFESSVESNSVPP